MSVRNRSVAIVVAIVVAVALFAFFAERSHRIPRLGFLGIDSRATAPVVAAFQDELRTLGYVDGRNIVIEYRWAEGRFERFPELAKELVGAKVDVIVTASPPAVRAAQLASPTIPIVMLVHDPVEMGFAASLARPGGNITGVSFQEAELAIKRLDLLRQAVPDLTRTAIVWNKEGGAVNAVNDVTAAARARGMQVRVVELTEPSGFDAAIAEAKAWGAQAVVELASPFLFKHRAVLLDALRSHRLPAACSLREYAADGCLVTYSADFVAIHRRLADYADRIMKGATPADLAIEQPREFVMAVNLKAAETLGLVLPPEFLVQATDVIR